MDYCWNCTEAERKSVHDHLYHTMEPTVDLHANEKTVSVNGPIIVGAGPSGLAVFACLKEKGLPSLILERSDCIGSLWQLRTYDRLHLHLSKQFCELPLMSFPPCFPTYPTKQHFIAYLEAYTRKFDIRPLFNRTVENAEYDQKEGVWNVRAVKRVVGNDGDLVIMVENYVSRWLVVATGENAEAVVPEIDGMEQFKGDVLHTSQYRRGDVFVGKKVLVVGCGNSGMEVCLDLCDHGAFPTIVVREGVHVLPRDMFGRSTFALSRWLLRWFPMGIVDAFLLLVSRFILGDTACVGLHRPRLGPLELKSVSGKSPVLDIGTLAKIKSGDVKVAPTIRKLSYYSVEFVDGRLEDFDAVILATGYRSNVPSWLKEEEGFFSQKDGMPRRPFPNGWKGKNSLYAVGFTKLGILGCSMDARRIADDIEKYWSIVTVVREEDAKNRPTSFFYQQQQMSAENGGTRFKTLDSVHYVSGF